MIDLDILLKQVVENDDENAFKQIFFDFFAPLCIFAHRYVDSREDCEDIVQNMFFALWEHRKGLVINCSIRNFLITNVRNACIDFLRRQYVQQAYAEREIQKGEQDPMDTAMLYAVTELEEKVKVALALLPENVRQSFEMNRFDGKTYPQIAQECNISVKTVEAHISKALKVLRVELRDYIYLCVLFM